MAPGLINAIIEVVQDNTRSLLLFLTFNRIEFSLIDVICFYFKVNYIYTSQTGIK